MQYSGVLATGTMSIAMLLVVRPVRFEPYLGGVDKMYRLHKWLGIAGLVTALLHWALSESPKWLGSLGLLTRPGGSRPHHEAVANDTLQHVLANLQGPAKGLGE